MPLNQIYHTGIRREKNANIWRRSGDGVQIQLEGWFVEYDLTYVDGRDFVYWHFVNGSEKNSILNLSDKKFYFICEY